MDSEHGTTSPLQRLRDAVHMRRRTEEAWQECWNVHDDPDFDANCRRELSAARCDLEMCAEAVSFRLGDSPGAYPVVAEWIPISSGCEMPEGQTYLLMAGRWIETGEWDGECWRISGMGYPLEMVTHWLRVELPPMVPKET